MPKRKIQHTEKQKKEWEDIFNTIDMNVIPLEYISRVLIKFDDGTTWDIDIDDSRRKLPEDELEDSLDELLKEYDDSIENIDFRLDLERVRHDLSRRVGRFLKLNK